MAVDDELDLNDSDIEWSVATLMETLPAPVRTFVRSQERKDIALALSQKYRLHVDQAGTFERSFLYMLLGVSSPTEFVSELRGAGIPDDIVTSLTSDLNEQVFKKLRRQEEAAVTPVPPPAPIAPAPPVPQPSPAPRPEPVLPPLESVRTMNTDMERAREAAQPQYQQPYMPQYPQMAVQYVPFPGAYQPMPPPPQTYWMPVPMPQMPPQYQYPQPPQYAPQPVPPAAPIPVPTPPPPAPVAETRPIETPNTAEFVPYEPPRRAEPPPNLPTSEPAAPISTPIKREYGVDPYHEPIQ